MTIFIYNSKLSYNINEKGYIEYILIIFVFIAFVLTGGLSSFSKPPLTATYTPITPTIGPTKTTMQLQTVEFNEITFTPAPTKASTAPQNPPATCDSAPSGNIALDIQKKFGIIVAGQASIDQLTQIYNTMCLLFRATSYQKILQSQTHPISITIKNNEDCRYGWSDPVPLQIGWCPQKADWALYGNRFVLTHELSHIMQRRNIGLFSNYFVSIYSKYPSIPTGNCLHAGENGFGPSKPNECFADMIAEYVVYKHYKHFTSFNNPSVTFSSYPTDYPAWYNFAKEHIFGGIEY